MAGTWTLTTDMSEGYVGPEPIGLWKIVGDFTDDASGNGLAETTITAWSGALSAVRVLFDETTTPDSLAVVIKDIDGNELLSETLTASGEMYMTQPKVIVGGFTLTVSGNSTASAVAQFSFLML